MRKIIRILKEKLKKIRGDGKELSIKIDFTDLIEESKLTENIRMAKREIYTEYEAGYKPFTDILGIIVYIIFSAIVTYILLFTISFLVYLLLGEGEIAEGGVGILTLIFLCAYIYDVLKEVYKTIRNYMKFSKLTAIELDNYRIEDEKMNENLYKEVYIFLKRAKENEYNRFIDEIMKKEKEYTTDYNWLGTVIFQIKNGKPLFITLSSSQIDYWDEKRFRDIEFKFNKRHEIYTEKIN